MHGAHVNICRERKKWNEKEQKNQEKQQQSTLNDISYTIPSVCETEIDRIVNSLNAHFGQYLQTMQMMRFFFHSFSLSLFIH